MKILKGCNCCNSTRRSVKLMGLRARIAHCRSCHAPTVWSALTPDELAARQAHNDRMEAVMARLMGDDA